MSNRYLALCAAATLSTLSAPALATPGVAEEVYSATVEPETEIETRYGRLDGRAADGEDALVLEVAHGFSNRFEAALLTELAREPGGGRHVTAYGVEAKYTLGRIGGIDTALNAEYEAARHGSDTLETKLIFEKRAGEIDARLNLVAEREMIRGAPVTFGYAASADVEVIGEFRLGAAVFGDLSGDEGGHHFAGPIVKTEVPRLGPGELELETGYLFALGSARDETRGQFRLLAAYAFPF